jgi:hypothetical protein
MTRGKRKDEALGPRSTRLTLPGPTGIRSFSSHTPSFASALEERREETGTRSRRRNGSARSKLCERRGLRLDSARGTNPSGWKPQLGELRSWRGLCGLRSASVTAIGPRAGRSATRAGTSLSKKVFVRQSDTLILGTQLPVASLEASRTSPWARFGGLEPQGQPRLSGRVEEDEGLIKRVAALQRFQSRRLHWRKTSREDDETLGSSVLPHPGSTPEPRHRPR